MDITGADLGRAVRVDEQGHFTFEEPLRELVELLREVKPMLEKWMEAQDGRPHTP